MAEPVKCDYPLCGKAASRCGVCDRSSPSNVAAPVFESQGGEFPGWCKNCNKHRSLHRDHPGGKDGDPEWCSTPSHVRPTTMIERAYCKANDYINALLTPSVDPESLKKIRAAYFAAVQDVMTCEGCRDKQSGCPTPDECAAVRRSYRSVAPTPFGQHPPFLDPDAEVVAPSATATSEIIEKCYRIAVERPAKDMPHQISGNQSEDYSCGYADACCDVATEINRLRTTDGGANNG